MMSFGSSFCPQCSSEIPVNRLQSTPVICPDCGWSQNTKEVKLHNYLQSKTIKVFLAFSIFISLGYFHSIKWGAHSFKVIPLQLNILTGNTHVNTFKNMAQICSNRQLHSCAAENLELASKIEPNNLELLAQLSTTLHKTNQKEKALAAYSRYFSQQGRDLDLAFHFANLLVEKGNYKEAKTYYEYILNAKPNIFQITVSHKYVHLLMKMGENKLARNFIFKIRKQGENATLFMNNELKEMAKL